MIDLRPLTLEDRARLVSCFERHPPEISEFTFTNLYAWRTTRLVWFAEVAGSLVFLVAPQGGSTPDILFGGVVGDTPILDILQALHRPVSRFHRLPENQARDLGQAGYTLSPDRDNADYVYLVRDLAELHGRRYAKKRNHIKQCLKQYRCEYEPFSDTIIEECLGMQDKWCDMRECLDDPSLFGEHEAIKETLLHFGEFDLIGGAIRVNGDIQAYAIAERLNPSTAVWHFEKAMPEINGLGQLINHWFAKYALQDFEFVNREQDLGLEGLRRAKKSYFPHHMVPKYKAQRPA